MTPAELGFLLLTSHLGDPQRRPLSPAQVDKVWKAVHLAGGGSPEGDVTVKAMLALGLPRDLAAAIPSLLSQEGLAKSYAARAGALGLGFLPRPSVLYPAALKEKLGTRAPGVLWYWGDLSILSRPLVSLVGSRDLRPQNGAFARAVGAASAKEGYALVSGNARGADRAGQEGALSAGGYVVCVLPDGVQNMLPPQPRQLYLWEDSYDLAFTPQRALSRNHIIHALGEKTYVAQVTDGQGGTWNGSIHNLSQGLSPLLVFRDGSTGAQRLIRQGGVPIEPGQAISIGAEAPGQTRLY